MSEMVLLSWGVLAGGGAAQAHRAKSKVMISNFWAFNFVPP
jgi:hypothetical protein